MTRLADRAVNRQKPEATKRSAQALEPNTRTHMEALFNHDFGQVRIYDDRQAALEAANIHAAAFTIGQNVTFGADRYAPQTPDGHQLLAHELTHVVQNSRHSSVSPRGLSQPSDGAEREANRLSARVAAGQGVRVQVAPSAGIARSPLDWLEEKASGAMDSLGSAGSAISSGASSALDWTKETGAGIYGGMKENAGYIRQGEHWLDGGVDWLEQKSHDGAHQATEQYKDTPILGSLLGANEWVNDKSTQAVGGVLKGATGLAGGLLEAAANPVDTAKSLYTMSEHIPGLGLPQKVLHGAYDLAFSDKSTGDIADQTFNPLEDSKYWGGVGRAVWSPYQKAIDDGKGAEAVGRGVFDIGSLLLGVGEVGGAAKVTEAAKIADAAKVADAAKAADLAKAADAAKAAEAAEAAKVSEAAKVLTEDELAEKFLKEQQRKTGITDAELGEIENVPQPGGGYGKRPFGGKGQNLDPDSLYRRRRGW